MQAPPIGDGEDEIIWHSATVDEALKLQAVTPEGLDDGEVQRRLKQYGRNELTPPPKPGFLRKLWMQINNILIFILICATIVSAILEEWPEVALICGVVIINVTIGLIQEGKAEKAAEAIKGMLSSKATVIRKGERTVVDAATVVPGDIVFIQSGDRVPADLRMINVANLAILEAMLTGESNPINKHTDKVEGGAALGDRKNLAFSATMVMQGQGTGIVIGTGDLAEIGKISSMVGGVDGMKTNLMVQLEIFGRWISFFVLIVGSITFIISFEGVGVGQDDLGNAFKSAVSIAVAIIPEGLPAVVTISLALAMQTLARRNAIIRQLPAVETLGSVTVICSDKTGTLTKNEMTVQAMQTAEGQLDLTGVGYAPDGELCQGGKPVSQDRVARILTMFEGSVLCNDSGLGKDDKGHWEPVGYPTEVSLLTMGMKLGAKDWKGLKASKPRVAAVPFASEHKFMCCVHAHGPSEDPATPLYLHVKGAPDRLIPRCKDQVSNEDFAQRAPMDEKYWTNEAARLSAKGLRVLAVCRADFQRSDIRDDMDADLILKAPAPFLTMIGLVAILDPPRPEAIEGVKVATRAGIVVKMITGDHPATATAIAKMLSIVPPNSSDKDVTTFTGPQLDAMDDDALDRIVLGCNVFARASPENKIRIVKSLQRMGQVSSMTGDGVNDAPALKAANIGVAMGITGTDVSKEAAKMVLADDNFATIVVAVKEGRRVWDNLVKVLMYNIPVNFAQGLSVFFSFVIPGVETVPLTAIQVLYVNMVTSVTMGMMLSMEPPEGDIMSRPPRKTNKRLFGKKVMWNVIFVSTSMVIAVIGVFQWSMINNPDEGDTRRAGASIRSTRIDRARGEAFNMLVFAEMAYALNCRYLRDSAITKKLFTENYWCWVAIGIATALQVFLTYTPGVNNFFYNGPIDGMAWVRILGFSTVIFFLVEAEKVVGPKYLMPLVRPIFNAIGSITPESMKTQRTETGMQSVRFIATSASTFGVPHNPRASPHTNPCSPSEHPHGYDHPVNEAASVAMPQLHRERSSTLGAHTVLPPHHGHGPMEVEGTMATKGNNRQVV